MLISPSVAITAKYSSMTGPKNKPTRAVPLRWIENKAMMIAMASGSTNLPRPGEAIATPSTADSTDTAGVIIESP
ncbi:hypothetical protein D9M73_110480 [compost metagenome]